MCEKVTFKQLKYEINSIFLIDEMFSISSAVDWRRRVIGRMSSGLGEMGWCVCLWMPVCYQCQTGATLWLLSSETFWWHFQRGVERRSRYTAASLDSSKHDYTETLCCMPGWRSVSFLDREGGCWCISIFQTGLHYHTIWYATNSSCHRLEI